MAYITMVKKILRSGQPCAKCRDVEARLKREGLYERIDRVVIAEEGNLDSEGMRLAEIYRVDRAPFFLVADESGNVQVHTVYYRFVKEVLKKHQNGAPGIQDLMDITPELDFV